MRTLRPFLILLFASIYAGAQTVNFSVTVRDSLKPISPYIYGTNQTLTGGENWTALRIGGNRLTGYNWENNASNAGSDYNQESDDYLPRLYGVSADSTSIQGAVTNAFYEQARRFGAYPLVTLQMAGFVAKDKNGIVDSSQVAPSPRWAYGKFTKGRPFSLVPDTTDDSVFMDEYVNFLVNKYGNANAATGIKGYELDNEPDLWNETHPRLHPLQTTFQELIQRSVALSGAVKNIDPYAEIFGPVSYGFNGYFSFQGAADWESISAGKSYNWFLDYYLDQMKKASGAAGKKLLDVLDLHWYSEAEGTVDSNRITDPGATTNNDQLARVQAPRTLWDSTYQENSWIGQYYFKQHLCLPLIPKVMQSINKYYPGTKLAFTEFGYGGENDISGADAMADVLGIFAKYGVYLATFWQLDSQSTFISAAYKIYRNYDGNNSTFGSLYAPSQTSDSVNSSIYGSITSDTNEIHLIVINKNFNQSVTGNFSITSPKRILSGRVWEINRNSSQIHEIDSVTDISNPQGSSDYSFSYPVNAASICHFVLKTSEAPTIVEAKPNIIPDKFSLAAYPNPFNPSTMISYHITTLGRVTLKVYDVLGREVATLVDGSKNAGNYQVLFDGGRLASGAYFVVLRSTDRMFASQKLLLLK